MFDFVHNNRQVVSVALGLVGVGLLIGGGFSRFNMGDDSGLPALAKVDGVAITQRDVAELTRGEDVPPAMMPQVIQQLVQRRLILNEADDRNFAVTDDQVRAKIQSVPAFQKDGHFDADLYKQLLASNHLTPERYENMVRDELRAKLVADSVDSGAFASKSIKDSVISLLATSRNVSSVDFNASQYLSKVTVSDADIKQYYESHHGEFNVPERIKLDYIVLSRDEMAAKLTISDADAKKYYDEHRAEVAPEERSVRHILVKVDATAPAAVRDAAKKKAEGVLAELKKNPERFAELAKQNSDDPGSAAQGGDLGYFQNNGTMVKPFADTAFKLAKGELSGIVETQFGYHILQLEDIRTKSFDDVKSVIVSKLQHQQAVPQFQAQSEKFNDSVYQQENSLQPTADAFKLEVRHSDWIMRDKAADPMLNNDKVREAAFSDDVLNKHHNSEAIDLGNGTFIAVHVVEHQIASLQPVAQVSPQISEKLKLERAKKMAEDEGKKALAALQKGEQGQYTWSAAAAVNQFEHEDMNKDAVKAVFAVPANKLPGYAGVAVDTGFKLYKVEAAKAQTEDPARHDSMVQALDRVTTEQQVEVYLSALKTQHKVEMH